MYSNPLSYGAARMTEEQVRFQWQVGAGGSLISEDLLRECGAEEVQTKAQREFEPFTIIGGLILLTRLVRLIRKTLKDRKYDYGLLIDAREKPVQIFERRDWDRGKVVVINAAGETTTMVDTSTDSAALEDFVAAAIRGLKPSFGG